MYNSGVNTLLIFFILFAACQEQAKDTDEKVTEQPTTAVTAKKVEKEPAAIEIYVWVDKLRLRTEPTTKSEMVTTLREGEALNFLNERSDFTEKINLRGTLFDEPWLKIATKNGQKGWVYGGGVKFYKIGVDEAPTPYDDCFQLQKERKMTQAAKCIDRTHFRALKKESSLVNESTNGLTFRLLSGEQFILNNVGRDSVYQFRYYLKEMAVFVVHATYGEREGYLLIDDKTGGITRTKGFPKASTDHEHIACLNPDWGDKGNFRGIQLLGYVGNELAVLFEQELADFRPVIPKWVDEKTLQFTLLEKDDKRNRKSRYGQLIQSGQGVWELEL
ncbi:MAG: SH3 domain-containing protein [Bacteroidota bacterium]